MSDYVLTPVGNTMYAGGTPGFYDKGSPNYHGGLSKLAENPVIKAVNNPAIRMASAAAMAYHGYRRTGSGSWAVLWALFGAASPVIAAPIALAQGYGRKK